ncbi:MAG: hypothetical protein M1813_009502 [Trichoglossum hirsutum]|nr:MAG: hypothetical protein M1813_009502 [Trichoglossum hirsutum]
MDAYQRHPKRSTTSLNHLSFAPLTPKFPIGDEDELLDFSDFRGRSSYIEGKSDVIPKSKSSSQLLTKSNFQRRSRRNLDTPSEWLQRAGAIISSETRESKGQSWLVTRASSTSLVDHEGREDFSFADDEFSPYSPRNSHGGSRVGSRVGSRHGSRSKIDLLTTRATRPGINGGRDELAGDFGNEFVAEPDFIDVDEDSHGEFDTDAELDRIARLRSFGLGSWVDRLIGWSLFAVNEDGEESEGEVDVEEREYGRVDAETRKKREETERVFIEPPSEVGDKQTAQRDQEGGWQDAAWLLSVATKVLF